MTPSESVNEHLLVVTQLLRECLPEIEEGAEHLVRLVKAGGTVFFFGNGGSAAMAQHLAAELSGPTIALADPASLTAIGNDRDFSEVFAFRVRALATQIGRAHV